MLSGLVKARKQRANFRFARYTDKCMNPAGRPRILWISSTSAKDHLHAAPSIMIAIALGVPPR
jgi:hypothetical protein